MERLSPEELKEFALKIPKVELHLHLEGAIPLETLLAFIRRAGTEPEIRTVDDLRERLAYADFESFIERWKWTNRFLGEEKDFEEIAYQVLRGLSRQNVAYVEISYAPGDYVTRPSSAQDKTAYVREGCEKAQDETGTRWGLIIDFCRADSPYECLRVLDDLTPWMGSDLVGIDLGGGRQGEPVTPYVPVFEAARARGLRTVAHAGESAGPASVWAVIDELDVERIGHGVRASEDAALLDVLKERRIPLEVCVTSNLMTGVYPSAAAHPIRDLFDQGLMVTVNADDPTMFHTTLSDEYLLLLRDLAFTPKDLRTLSLNGVDASFLPDDDKRRLRNRFEEEWDGLLKEYA